MERQAVEGYWKRNLRLMVILLAIWAFVSLVLAIILVKTLNEVTFAGWPLGFWMAQQGAIFTFVVLIFVYARTMDRYDNELEMTLQAGGGGAS